MKKCPACGSAKYKEGVCRKCGFRNDPNYLRRENGNESRGSKSN